MADQDQNKTPELFAACQKLNQQALSKCRAGDGPPSILVLDTGLKALYESTAELLKSFVDRHSEKLSSIIGDSDTEKKAIRDPYASIMDKSYDDIVTAYINDKTIPQGDPGGTVRRLLERACPSRWRVGQGPLSSTSSLFWQRAPSSIRRRRIPRLPSPSSRWLKQVSRPLAPKVLRSH